MGVLLFAAAAYLGRDVVDALDPYGFQDPDSNSVRAYDLYEEVKGIGTTPEIIALVEPGGDVHRPEAQREVQEVASALGEIEGVGAVRAPAPGETSATSTDGRAAYVLGFLRTDVDDPTDVGADVQDQLAGRPGVTLGGTAVAQAQLNEQTGEDLRRVELYAAPLLILLSLWVFRSLIAALLPILVGAFTIAGALFIVRALAEVISIDVFSINLVTALGLGLAIDYSLFVVSRYRGEVARLGAGPEALRRTLQTAGRTVAFSAVTVACALAALLVFPQRFLDSMGIGGSLVALFAGLVVLTVLPAMLAMLGPRVNALRVPGFRRSLPEETSTAARQAGFWFGLARFVARAPVPIAAMTAVVLIAAGIPFLRVEFSLADAGILPEERSARQVDDVLRDRFPAGETTPIVVLVNPPQTGDTEASGLAARISAIPTVDRVIAPRSVGEHTQRIDVIAAADPNSDASQRLVRRIRALGSPDQPLVAGRAADLVDQKQSLRDHLPAAVAIIVVSTLLILFLLTGSVVLPLKALVMNLLTISAAFGILVLVFQDGRFEGPLEYASEGALDTSIPVLMFAVVFGLSTDYGIFLLTRIKEAYDAGADNSSAVAIGLQRTGRIVTAAALLFAVALGALAFSELLYLKEVGLGTALAVLIDAAIIRTLLVPSLMQILGPWNWWAPRPLARIHERFGTRAT